jgi:SAM-dependent methyltransferase
MIREQLAGKHIRGSGCEIGGLHVPTKVLPGAKVTYVDRLPPGEAHPDVQTRVHDLVVDDAEFLTHFHNDTLDFVIANHVLEHCHDPIGTLKNWCRVLKPGGIVYCALPDKEQTFDKPRATTTLLHLIDDHENGSGRGDIIHLSEWHYHIDGLRGQALEDRVKFGLDSRSNIHFHLWDEEGMQLLFNYVGKELEILEKKRNGAEIIWVLRKIPA